MKRFSIIHPIYMSFYSRELYRDVARNWGGTVFVYLFVLLALCWIPALGKLKAEMSGFMQYELPKVVSQIPEITITDGTASVDAEMPYTITEPDTGKPIAILDTTGRTTSLKGMDAVVLLTKDKLIAKKNEAETRIYELSEFGDAVINQELINGWVDTFNKWFFILIYPFVLFFSFIFRMLQALVYGLIGMLYDRTLKAGLGYQAIVRLAAIAVTPAIILNTVRFSMGWDVPGWTFISFMVAMGYLYFGVMANVEGKPATGVGRGEY